MTQLIPRPALLLVVLELREKRLLLRDHKLGRDALDKQPNDASDLRLHRVDFF